MNLNIVKYILETTDMTQTDIANKLKAKKRKGSKEETKVSQASISQWSRGGIPDDRAIELLKIAGLYWELEDVIDYDSLEDQNLPEGEESIPFPDFLREKSVDSNWSVLVKTEKNQNDWYDFIADMISPKQYHNIESEYNHNDFVKFARECLLLLNYAGFTVPENPKLIKSTDSALYNLFRNWNKPISSYENLASDLSRLVYDEVLSRNGSISAEHGIGRLKKEQFLQTSDRVKIETMKAIKNAMDPSGLFNPGVLL